MRTSHKNFNGGFAFRSIMVLTLLLAVSQVQANPGRDRGYERGDWRLGPHNQILMKTDRGWRRVPGTAIDVGDGWVIGTDRRAGGFGIYRWNGREFDRVSGGAVEIGGSYHSPWVVNNRGERFEWTGRDWREVRGYGYSQRDSSRHDYSRRDSSRYDSSRHDSSRHDSSRHDSSRYNSSRYNSSGHDSSRRESHNRDNRQDRRHDW